MGENQQSMFFRVSDNGGYLKYMPMLKGENDDPSNLLVPYIYIYSNKVSALAGSKLPAKRDHLSGAEP